MNMVLREGLVKHQTLRLGMAQFGGLGLSENWLLKHLGDTHWELIAQALGQDRAVFHDLEGRPVYAAFCATSLRLSPALAPAPGEDLHLQSRLGQLSPTRLMSRHRFATPQGQLGELRLISAFVSHGEGRSNQRIIRNGVAGHLELDPIRDEFHAVSSALAKGNGAPAFGSPAGPAQPAQIFTPCPAVDFNGVGLLYFPSFSAFLDRADWAQTAPQTGGKLLRRDMVYLGNLDPGEQMHIRLHPHDTAPARRAHRAEIRAGDGRMLCRAMSLFAQS